MALWGGSGGSHVYTGRAFIATKANKFRCVLDLGRMGTNTIGHCCYVFSSTMVAQHIQMTEPQHINAKFIINMSEKARNRLH